MRAPPPRPGSPGRPPRRPRLAALRAAPARPPPAPRPRESPAAPAAPAGPARTQPPSGRRRRALRRRWARSSRHRSAPGPPRTLLPALRPPEGRREPPELLVRVPPARPRRLRPSRGANGEVLTYLSLLSTPSWIHLSTSPQSIVGKPSPALLPARRAAGEGGGRPGGIGGAGVRRRWDRGREPHLGDPGRGGDGSCGSWGRGSALTAV